MRHKSITRLGAVDDCDEAYDRRRERRCDRDDDDGGAGGGADGPGPAGRPCRRTRPTARSRATVAGSADARAVGVRRSRAWWSRRPGRQWCDDRGRGAGPLAPGQRSDDVADRPGRLCHHARGRAHARVDGPGRQRPGPSSGHDRRRRGNDGRCGPDATPRRRHRRDGIAHPLEEPRRNRTGHQRHAG